MQYYIGTNNKGDDAGIYSVTVKGGKIDNKRQLVQLNNATWLDYNSSKKQLLATSTVRKGSLHAYKVAEDGGLNETGKSAAGAAPCYICRNEDRIHVANYSSGNISSYVMDEKGALSDQVLFQHEGSSINQRRQEQAHAHQIVFAPDRQWALSCDLGCDKIFIYQSNAEKGLQKHGEVAIKYPGSGPRHLCFHKTEPLVYVLNELAGSLDVLEMNYKLGTGKLIHHLEVPGESASDIRQYGRFLYAGLRSNNTIAVLDMFHAHEPQFIEAKSVAGRPRGFVVTDDGAAVIVGNEREDVLELYARDQKTGLLLDRLDSIAMPAPVCMCSVQLGHQHAIYGA